MPRFFFNICDDDGSVPDTEGMDCPDIAAAKKEAEESARDLLVHDIRSHQEIDHRRVEVRDEQGKLIATVRLRDLVN